MLAIPLLRERTAIGTFTLTRDEVNPFTEKQKELATTFADQAVIAIESARLFDEVQARTRDLSESLRQQTATADVLKVISRSTFDLQTVLDTLVELAVCLCEAERGLSFRRDGEILSVFGGKADILFARWTRRIGFCSGGEGSGSSPPISELTAQIICRRARALSPGSTAACSTNPALPAAGISVVGNWL